MFLLLLSCARQQTESRKGRSTIHADKIEGLYRQLGKQGDEGVERVRKLHDDYCRKNNASHKTNLTVIGCFYDLHTKAWTGRITVESSCTIGNARADYRREFVLTLKQDEWLPREPGASSSSLHGDPPKPVRKTLKGFSSTLSMVFPKVELVNDWD